MKQCVYCLKDRIGWFQQIMSFMSDDLAIRWFSVYLSNTDSKQIADDLSLYRIGEFNVESGQIKGEDFPVLIADGKDYV